MVLNHSVIWDKEGNWRAKNRFKSGTLKSGSESGGPKYEYSGITKLGSKYGAKKETEGLKMDLKVEHWNLG